MHWDLGSIIAGAFLACVAAGLVFAAAYGFAAHPVSKHAKHRQIQIKNGFRLAGGVVIGLVLYGGLLGGSSALAGGPSRFSRPVGGVIAAICATAIALTVQSWGKYFAGWVAWAIFNALVTASSGRLFPSGPNSIPVSRKFALWMAAIFLISVVASARFIKGYLLNWAEKSALVGWIFVFTTAVILDPHSTTTGLKIMSIGPIGLVLAWIFRVYTTHRRHRKAHSTRPALNAQP